MCGFENSGLLLVRNFVNKSATFQVERSTASRDPLQTMQITTLYWKKLLCSDHKERSNKRCICPSVCPSVAYIANNSRTQRHSVPKFGMKVPHLRCDWHTSFKVKRSKVKVTNRRGHTLSAKRGGTRLVIKQLTNLGQTFKNLIFKPCLQSLCFDSELKCE